MSLDATSDRANRSFGIGGNHQQRLAISTVSYF